MSRSAQRRNPRANEEIPEPVGEQPTTNLPVGRQATNKPIAIG